MSVYEYPRLPNNSTYIRLLTIKSIEERVECSLAAFPIIEAPKYYALSYSCGTEPASERIHLDCGYICVSPHLLEGLKSVYQIIKPLKLWIDAICINQKYVDEMNGQIPLMTQIYGGTEKVLIWLGKEGDGSNGAMNAIPKLCEDLGKFDRYYGAQENYELSGFPLDDPVWENITQLLSRQWFQRLWVLQEVILPKAGIFICGSCSIGMKELCDFGAEVRRTDIRMNETLADTDGIVALNSITIMRTWIESGKCPSLALALRGRGKVVTEPIDRVYGVLGMMTEQVRRKVPIDYSVESKRAYWKAYCSLARAISEVVGFDLLLFAGLQNELPELPSWCPNWNAKAPSDEVTELSKHFRAGYEGVDEGSHEFRWPMEQQALELSGIELDTVTVSMALNWNRVSSLKKGEEWQWFGSDGYAAQNLQSLKAAWQLVERSIDRPHDELLADFAKTLVADTSYGEHSRTKEREFRKFDGNLMDEYNWSLRYFEACRISHGEYTQMVNGFMASGAVNNYFRSLTMTLPNQKLLVTEDGKLGLSPQDVHSGDLVCIFIGAKWPAILRPIHGENSYHFIGFVYISGMMYGEILSEYQGKVRDFIIA